MVIKFGGGKQIFGIVFGDFQVFAAMIGIIYLAAIHAGYLRAGDTKGSTPTVQTAFVHSATEKCQLIKQIDVLHSTQASVGIITITYEIASWSDTMDGTTYHHVWYIGPTTKKANKFIGCFS
jgi:hypothetical protein